MSGRSNRLLFWWKCCNLTPDPKPVDGCCLWFLAVMSVWITSVSVLTVALHKFVSALLRQNPHYPRSSPLWVIIGFQSTRPLTPLSSNLTVHKQIFVAAETAASEAAARSGVWKFYQTCTVHLNCRMVLNVNDMKLGSVSAPFLSLTL